MLGLASNWMAAGLLLFTIFFYTVVYSVFLKRRTPQNIVIGGAAGAFPPIIGWVAMTESINLLPIILFIIIFLWTPPHFWSLALVKTEDYKKANIPMMPNVVGESSTKKQILFYSFLLLISSLSPFILGLTGYIYFFGSFTMSLGFCVLSIGLIIFPNRKLEIPLFVYSIFYLFGIFVFLVIDKYFVV